MNRSVEQTSVMVDTEGKRIFVNGEELEVHLAFEPVIQESDHYTTVTISMIVLPENFVEGVPEDPISAEWSAKGFPR